MGVFLDDIYVGILVRAHSVASAVNNSVTMILFVRGSIVISKHHLETSSRNSIQHSPRLPISIRRIHNPIHLIRLPADIFLP